MTKLEQEGRPSYSPRNFFTTNNNESRKPIKIKSKSKSKINLKNQETLLREKIESLKSQIDYQRFEGNNRAADLLTIELVRINGDLRHNRYLQEREKNLKQIAVLGASVAALFGIILFMSGVL
jgi:hypothetical protein